MLGVSPPTWGQQNVSVCVIGMPCGGAMTKGDLRQAYRFCETDLRSKACDGGTCFAIPNGFGPKYISPECVALSALWLKSDWKRQDDAAEKHQEEERLEHAKRFVGAVSKQKAPTE